MIHTIPYTELLHKLPKSGAHINAQCSQGEIIVYQAFRETIADYAVKCQTFGGPYYSYNRMSWIKTSFLWMMYRSGWAAKEGQERVLAISLMQRDFDIILTQSVPSTYNSQRYRDVTEWKNDLSQKEVRLQWDPDHDPFGNPVDRRAIQLGLKGDILTSFGKKYIIKIEDITDFVKEQSNHVLNNQLDKLMVPDETLYVPSDTSIVKRIGLT